MAETLFLLFSTRRPWPKANFRRFSFVGHGRNAEFICFWFSAAAETLFFSFSAFQPWRKWYFCCFPLVRRGRKSIFSIFSLSAVADERFSMKIDDSPPYLNSFFWKSAIYYRIWTVFLENLQFTIVSEQIFPKIDDLLPYLSDFSRKSIISSRIWVIFPENWWFTPVSEWFSLSFIEAQLHIRNWSIGTLFGA